MGRDMKNEITNRFEFRCKSRQEKRAWVSLTPKPTLFNCHIIPEFKWNSSMNVNGILYWNENLNAQ